MPVWDNSPRSSYVTDNLAELDLHLGRGIPNSDGTSTYRVGSITPGSGNLIGPTSVFKLHAPNDYDANIHEKRFAKKARRSNQRRERKSTRDTQDDDSPIHFQSYLGVEDGLLSRLNVGTRISIKQFETHELVKIFCDSLPTTQPGAGDGVGYARKEGWGKMDYSRTSATHSLSTLPGSDVAMDNFDFGNAVWGAAMYCMMVPQFVACLGANYNSLVSHREMDTKSDQRAIRIGHRWAEENRIDRLVWPSKADRRFMRR